MGELWESAVQLAKVHLHRAIGERIPRRILIIEAFNTLIVDVKSALNTHSLT